MVWIGNGTRIGFLCRWNVGDGAMFTYGLKYIGIWRTCPCKHWRFTKGCINCRVDRPREVLHTPYMVPIPFRQVSRPGSDVLYYNRSYDQIRPIHVLIFLNVQIHVRLVCHEHRSLNGYSCFYVCLCDVLSIVRQHREHGHQS